MKFKPETYRIPDEPMRPFIDAEEIWAFLNRTAPVDEEVDRVIDRSLNKHRLTLREVATLLNAATPSQIRKIKEGARDLKRNIYGNRVELFAPLYLGNKCSNECTYCGFRSSNKAQLRKTLSGEELVKEIEALEDNGQKRLILVYGEHAEYDPAFIAETVRTAYRVKKGKGEIRRVNINAAHLTNEGYRTV